MLDKIIEERGVGIHHLLTASLLGSAAELGLLNQITVTLIVRSAGKHVAEFLKIKDGDAYRNGDPVESVKKIMGALDVAKEYDVSGGADEIKVAVPTNLCKLCPKGVAGAEFLGTACPLPGLIESTLKTLVADEWSLVQMDGKKHFVKEGDFCRFAYSRNQKADDD
ncbi:MAG: hypothetical protein PVH29_13430 [Candidatus Zixiibacteriota bacterium]|jgi:hypothetical protein